MCVNEGKTGGNMNMQGAEAVKVDELKYLRPPTMCTMEVEKRVQVVGGDECQG